MPKRDLLTVILLFAAVSGSALTAVATVNYLSFYPTLEQLQLSLTSFQYNSTGQSLTIAASFLIKNQASYRGLEMKAFGADYGIELPQNVTMDQGSLPDKRVIGQLGPGASITATFKFNSTVEAARRVRETLDAGGDVKFVFRIDLILVTFLDEFTGVSPFYLCEARQGPAACEQLFIALSTRTEQGGGLGGGV